MIKEIGNKSGSTEPCLFPIWARIDAKHRKGPNAASRIADIFARYTRKDTESPPGKRAVVKGYEYIKNNDSTKVAKALAPSFAGISEESLKITVESYLAIDAWCSTPVMQETAFNKLQDVMQNAGELSNRASFSQVVDNSLAKEVMSELNK